MLFRSTLRQLFLGQFVIGLLLGWWVITRHDEIGERRIELDWQARERAAEAIFGRYGWYVKIYRDTGTIGLWNPDSFAVQPVTDTALDLVAQHDEVVELYVRSDLVSDEGLKRLASAKNLRLIKIASSQITDEGFHTLAKLPSLEQLDIDSPHLTLDDLKRLPGAQSLKFVIVRGLTLTRDEYLELLAAQPKIGWSVEWKD